MKLCYLLMISVLFSCGSVKIENTQNPSFSVSLLSVGKVDDRLDSSFAILERKTIRINDFELDFVLVPGGESELHDHGTPTHNFKTQILKENLDPYWISTTVISQEIYSAVMGRNPSVYIGGSYPIHNIGYADATLFIKKLNEHFYKNNIEIEVALPNEFQWVYAVSGGQNTDFYWGDDVYDGSDFEWLNFTKDRSAMMHPIAQKKPNPYGLYDGVGNCTEFTNPLTTQKNIFGEELASVMGMTFEADVTLSTLLRYPSPSGKGFSPWLFTSFRLVCK